jgi:hypothetical protein
MRIATILERFIGYFADAAAKIFGPDRNEYPKIGVQPFEGDINKESN